MTSEKALLLELELPELKDADRRLIDTRHWLSEPDWPPAMTGLPGPRPA